MKKLYEILIPTKYNDSKILSSEFHRSWNNYVLDVAGGLTVLPICDGQWINPEGKLFVDRIIPVRIMTTPEKMESIVNMSAKYYEQQCIMYYVVSNAVKIKHFTQKVKKNTVLQQPVKLAQLIKCEKCGFKFSNPGEFRNCEAFITKEGQSGIKRPGCGGHYLM